MDATYAVFGINSDGLNLAVNLLILFLGILWFALIFWTYADARRRIEDPMLVGCAAAASFFPFVGTVIYMIVRPPEFLDDVRLRELEMQAAVGRIDHQYCPHCDHEVQRDFLRCPHCLNKLKDPCRNCSQPLDAQWQICPYCEAEVAQTQLARPARRRRSGVTEDRPRLSPERP